MRSSLSKALKYCISAVAFIAIAHGLTAQTQSKVKMKKESFGKMADGREVDLYTMTNAAGMEVRIANYGGYIVSIKTPDRSGKLDDVVLGFDNLEGYLSRNPFFGCIVGRYGNRIGKAKFKLNGVEYTLAKNNGENHLHGGLEGFDKKLWSAKQVGDSLALSYLSKDGEEGYPGNLSVTVTYALTDNNELKIDYEATTDKDTVINLTNHTYFNLSGAGNGDILQHEIMINAEKVTAIDSGLIPTGELRPVKGTALDFTQPAVIGARINAKEEQMEFGRGYDHNYVLNNQSGRLALAARAHDPSSGRVLEVLTTQPGVQFYTGNFLDGSLNGKGGKSYKQRYGFCLETQHYPDSPNRPEFPSAVLKKGGKYRTTTVFKFSVKR